MISVPEILVRAADIVENEGWCQGVLARNRQGKPTDIMSLDASAWCAQGAIQKAAQELAPDMQEGAVSQWEGHLRDAVCWNDDPARNKYEVASELDYLAEALWERGSDG